MNEVPPGSPLVITFIEPDHDRGLPVALGAEAVAVGHQPLDREPGQLAQPVEVLERVGEGAEAAARRGMPRRPTSIRAASRRSSRRSPPAPQRGRDLVLRVVGARRARPPSASGTARTASARSLDAVAVDRDAELDLGLDLVALGDRDLAHVVPEAGDPQVLRLVPASTRPAPSSRSGRRPADPASGRRRSCGRRPGGSR